MAKMHYDGVDREMLRMTRLQGNLTDTVIKSLRAGAEEYVKARKQEIQRRGFVDNGDMLKGVKSSKKVDKKSDMVYVTIFSRGKGKNGVRNAEKEYLLHYGVKGGKSGQRIPSSHWVDEAERKALVPANWAMDKVWDEATNY